MTEPASFFVHHNDVPGLRDFLMTSESEIRRRATGPYWRWYFRLTG